MLGSFDRWRIIAAVSLATLLAACSALRLTYNQGPQLLYWWIDGYVDIADAQEPRVRDAIERWFRWHRSEQLPRYMALLERAEQLSTHRVSADALCTLWDEARQRADAALAQGVPAIAGLARTLTPEQLQHIERKFEKSNREFRRDHLQADKAERQRATLKRARERVERVYGTLDAGQRDWLAQRVAASPYDAERADAERIERQHDVLRTLRGMIETPLPAAQAEGAIRALGERMLHTPRPAYREYIERLTAYNCALVADLHNAATPAQREHARDRIRGWIEDLRALTAEARAAAAHERASGTVTRRGLTAGVGKSFIAASNIAPSSSPLPAM